MQAGQSTITQYYRVLTHERNEDADWRDVLVKSPIERWGENWMISTSEVSTRQNVVVTCTSRSSGQGQHQRRRMDTGSSIRDSGL